MPKVKTIDDVEAPAPEDKRTAEKVLVPVHEPEGGLYLVKYTAGGEVPGELSGKYTSLQRAADAIASYLRGKEQEATAG